MMTRYALPLMMLLAASQLTGCGDLSPRTNTPAADSFCTAARPLRFSMAAVAAMERSDLEQAKAHNCVGRKLCGWVQSECDL